MELVTWAYEAPQKHQHKTSGWSLVDDEVDGEIVLVCSRCNAHWHTGRPADDDYHGLVYLKVAAAAWLRDELLGKVTRRQLPLPLVVETVLYTPPKRRYTPTRVVDMSAQMALPLAA
jgi:hypothetical protein